MNGPPRIAFFTDSFHEVNGVAHTSRNFDAFARRERLPFLNVHAGPETRLTEDGPVRTLELRRGSVGIPLEHDMSFDLFLIRYWKMVADQVKHFAADLIHITGPSDIGMLGVFLAHRLRLPLVASWHTNIHEFGGRRLAKTLARGPRHFSIRAARFAEEKVILPLSLRYYRFANVLLAPNVELVNMLRQGTGKPTFLMQRGVDATLFEPEKRSRKDDVLTIGFVGRLSPEKNVRVLRDIALALRQAGIQRFRISVVGEGHEREWLRQNVPNVELAGMLFGDDLARAYANMDIFAFPSQTDTFGNVVLESLASGVPAVVMPGGGPKYIVMDGVTGFVAGTDAEFLQRVMELAGNEDLRERMGARAREHALCRHWNRIFEQVYDTYEYCLRSTRSVPLRPPLCA
jgi:phosphatidylinositol alpha 1,6-mannosyltransferase